MTDFRFIGGVLAFLVVVWGITILGGELSVNHAQELRPSGWEFFDSVFFGGQVSGQGETQIDPQGLNITGPGITEEGVGTRATGSTFLEFLAGVSLAIFELVVPGEQAVTTVLTGLATTAQAFISIITFDVPALAAHPSLFLIRGLVVVVQIVLIFFIIDFLRRFIPFLPGG